MAKQDLCNVSLFRNDIVTIVRSNLDWCTERGEKKSHSVINVKSTVAIFKQWSNISRLTAFGMTTIIPSFWSMENCSQTCQNGRIAAGRLPRPGLVFSIVASVFLIFDLSMERESATFAMTDKSPSASSSAVVASSIVYLLGAFASILRILIRSLLSGTLRLGVGLRGIVIHSAPCATDSVRLSSLGRSLDHEEEHSRVMLFGVKSNKSPNSGQMLIFIVLLEHLLVWCCAVHYQTVLFFRGAEERPQTIHRCWCRVRNGQNPTAMMMQPPNLTVDSADLVLAAFRAMLLFAARAHAKMNMSFTTLRTFLMSSKTVPLSSGFALSRNTVFISKSEQGPSPIRHSRFQHQQQHTLQLTYYRHTPLIVKLIVVVAISNVPILNLCDFQFVFSKFVKSFTKEILVTEIKLYDHHTYSHKMCYVKIH
ncbi:hypothetical protein T05_1280 [Trichinella murrelli]|uniref:Uncharacterized protein n=1 Tax=Trichinella murrelli TaxID=144512 RepID=A0A0V0TRE4_9BILA|nr:hypothetical protein T05_1280 [Trichinella murrelli]